MISKKEMICEVLKQHSCLTSKEILNFVYHRYNELLTTSAVSGILRPMVAAARVSKGVNEHGKAVYWLVDEK